MWGDVLFVKRLAFDLMRTEMGGMMAIYRVV